MDVNTIKSGLSRFDSEKESLIRGIILENDLSLKEKEVALNHIPVEYLEDYCVNNQKVITFTNGVVESVSYLTAHCTKRDLIGILLDTFSLRQNCKKPTFLELVNDCLLRNLITKRENNYHYNKKFYKKLLYESIQGETLLYDVDYILSSSPTAFNLRALCFERNLIDNINLKKTPKRPGHYEDLLGFKVHIKRKKEKLVVLEARGKGFENTDTDNSDASFKFLGKQKYPSTLREYISMDNTFDDNGVNLVEKYNRGVESAYDWLKMNITQIPRYPLGHKKFSRLLLYKILQIHFPYILNDIHKLNHKSS